MIYDILSQSPFPWILLSGLFTGAALSRLTRQTSNAKDPARARDRKIFWAMLGFSCTVTLLLLAIFVPGPQKILDIRLLYFFTGATALFFFVFRFKKAAGIPFFILAVVAIGSLLLFLQSIMAYTGETEIARLSILSRNVDFLSFELQDPRGNITKLDMPGTHLGAEVKLIIFDDLAIFLGQKTWYRFVGLKSAEVRKGSEMTTELRQYELARPEGISEALYRLVMDNQAAIPGIKTVQVQVTYVEAKPLTTYSVMIQNDSGVEVVRAR
ncbi:MAG: hypothetical protein EHM28_00620 [Spirochaetaceae bacterium]|nr:MAG: hypothetical protein EHM28_00620 [Spirochaetaceae bacterium]